MESARPLVIKARKNDVQQGLNALFFRLPSEAGKPVGLKEARIALTEGKIIRIAMALLANGRV